MDSFSKLDTHLFYDPAILLIGIYQRKMDVHKMTCPRMVPETVNHMFPKKYPVAPTDTFWVIISLTNSSE